jgi:SAM-dependent methyltransferase
MTADYTAMVRSVIDEHRRSPIDMLNTGDAEGEYQYLKGLEKSYVRTLRDIDQLFDTATNHAILEVGSFLGVVSAALKSMGYAICALDIPEFHQSERLQAYYARHQIPFIGANLRDYGLPYEDATFDAVVACEVIEHLNFNPLPVLQEFNRVLKPGGYLYLGTPNQADFFHRLRLLRGRSIRNPIEDFFAQLDASRNMIVGLHWREYTIAELSELVERMGFGVHRAYHYTGQTGTGAKAFVKSIIYQVPSLRPFQVVIGKKSRRPDYAFRITDSIK